MSATNNDKNSARVNQEQSPAWIAAKFILVVPTLAVVCVGFLFAMTSAINMADVRLHGIHTGHIPCDASIIFCVISQLIAGLGIWLLRWFGRIEAAWNQLQPFFARSVRQSREQLGSDANGSNADAAGIRLRGRTGVVGEWLYRR